VAKFSQQTVAFRRKFGFVLDRSLDGLGVRSQFSGHFEAKRLQRIIYAIALCIICIPLEILVIL